MKQMSTRKRLWFYRVLTLTATAAIVHLVTVWAAPRLIMRVLMDGPMAHALNMQNQAAFPAPVNAASRSVVMPSPDMLYSVCVYDVSAGPVQIKANPGLQTYWSVALYSANSDNFFVLNDRKAAGKPVDLWLVSERGNPDGRVVPEGVQVVVSPSTKGFLLMRVLTGNYEAEKSVLEPARRTLVCNKV